ncbi:MAG: type II toxin-antitoxin system RelE/ParE family toxin [Chloroflexi bacterium]|nr:type II toxin-antitoxin system RelE/ParE family toxin [Chloroflexota bacterium]
MPHRVELSPSAQRDLRSLPPRVAARLAGPIRALAAVPRPHSSRKLRGQQTTWRVRVGPYRIIYDVYDDRELVVVLRVDRRNESTYRL